MQTMNFMLMVRSIKGVTIMMELNCELNNGVKVKTYTAIGARYLSVYMPQANDRPASYTLSIDEWDANKISKLLNKMMYLTAQVIEAAFVYDDITEEGIWESFTLAKAGQIGWVQRGRNEGYEYIKNPTELADFLIKKGAFKDVPPMLLGCIDNIRLGNKLMYGDTLYLLETGADGFTEHIHKYESGCYWYYYNRILYKID